MTADFVIALFIFDDFLRITHVAHKGLQSSDITLASAGAIVARLKMNISNRRSFKSFVVQHRQAEELCKTASINMPSLSPTTGSSEAESVTPSRVQRSVKTASSLRDYLITTTLGQREGMDASVINVSHTRQEPEKSHWFQQLYLPVCDTFLGQLECRFGDEALAIAKAVDAVIHCKSEGIQPLINQYGDILHINPRTLTAEMELFASTDDKITIDNIQKELTKSTYPQYYKLVQLALTLPVGTATAERRFSAMRRIRN